MRIVRHRIISIVVFLILWVVLPLAIAVGQTYADYVAEQDNVILHWKLDETGTLTTAADAVNSNHGTYNNTSHLTGGEAGLINEGTCVDWDGGGEADGGTVTIADGSGTLFSETALSIEFITDNCAASGPLGFVDKDGQSGFTIKRVNATWMAMYVGTSNKYGYYILESGWADRQHWLWVFDSAESGSDTLKLYLNGSEVTLTYGIDPDTMPANTEDLVVGLSQALYEYDGLLDEVVIYDDARTAEEALESYYAGLGDFNGFDDPGIPIAILNSGDMYGDFSQEANAGWLETTDSGDHTTLVGYVTASGDSLYAVIVEDGSGYEAWGWIRADNGAEVLGNEVLDNISFEDWTVGEPDDWSSIGFNETTRILSQEDVDDPTGVDPNSGTYMAKMEYASGQGDAGYLYSDNGSTLTIGACYKIEAYYNIYAIDSWVRFYGIWGMEDFATDQWTETTSGWELASAYNTATSTSNRLIAHMISTNDDTIWYVDDFSQKRVTSAGIGISAEQDGTSPGEWNIIDSSFDYNDITEIRVYYAAAEESHYNVIWFGHNFCAGCH